MGSARLGSWPLVHLLPACLLSLYGADHLCHGPGVAALSHSHVTPACPSAAQQEQNQPATARLRAGGFFASGFKRALGIKDFGDSIPGHGGVTDRFDCQMMMVVFTYLYFHAYIARDAAEADLLDAAMDLTAAAKLRIFERLGGLLAVDGVLDLERLQEFLQTAGAAR